MHTNVKTCHPLVPMVQAYQSGHFVCTVQIEEARQELLSRLTPQAQAFLAKRAAAKQTIKATATPAAATAGPKLSSANGNRPATAGQQKAPASQQTGVPAKSMHSNLSSSRQRAAPERADAAHRSAGTALNASADSKACSAEASSSRHTSSAGRDTGANCTPAEDSQSQLIGRLRFSLEGKVVGLRALSGTRAGPEVDQQVVQRDILRYTLPCTCDQMQLLLKQAQVYHLHLLFQSRAGLTPSFPFALEAKLQHLVCSIIFVSHSSPP